MSRRGVWLPVIAAAALGSSSAVAVTSTRSVPSAFDGNGHNAAFDGRLFIARDAAGWQARLLRPEGATFLPDGFPDALGPIWSPKYQILGPSDIVENALAICEPDASQAPYACDEAGSPAAGPFDCYSIWIIDSDASTPVASGGAVLRRRHVLLWVAAPKTADATVYKVAWDSGIEPLGQMLMGIEPTVSADGKLLVWQGNPANDGTIDVLMYSVNDTPCAASGWSKPAPLSHMHVDPLVVGKYALAERELRAADGTPFADGALLHGAYPWLMPDGAAVVFAAAPMACKAPDDPPGCGPRRNAVSVIGYPTNWGVAHIDGGVNPSTDNTVRLFFSSPGPKTFPNLPTTPGKDVWPFFGSNTSNYVELVFDDGLDGNYAGFWHLNESVGADGQLDTSKTPDVSGYFNTGVLHGGLTFASDNDGLVGKSLTFDGIDDYVEVPPAQSLNPVNGITLELSLRPSAPPDCDANNNYRLVLAKGTIGDGAYTLVFEENGALQARVDVGGEEQALASPAIAMDGSWTRVAFEYDGATGAAGFWFDDAQVASGDLKPGTITPSDEPLRIGAPGPRDACPDGDGAFAGQIDEVAVSRYARHLGRPPVGSSSATSGVGGAGSDATSAGVGAGPSSGAGLAGTGASNADSSADGASGCACRVDRRHSDGAGWAALLAAAVTAAARTADRRRRRRRSCDRGDGLGRRARHRKRD